jgi:excisionase family DNA binding protein
MSTVPNLRISEAAALMGVSDDTVRRWIENGRLASRVGDNGRKVIEGTELAAFVQQLSDSAEPGSTVAASARNRMRGIVTRVVKDGGDGAGRDAGGPVPRRVADEP